MGRREAGMDGPSDGLLSVQTFRTAGRQRGRVCDIGMSAYAQNPLDRVEAFG
jgi:hypothetical protein